MSLKLSKTAVRELTRLYRGVLVAAIIATAVASTGAKAADYYVATTSGGTNDTSITLGTAAASDATAFDASGAAAAAETAAKAYADSLATNYDASGAAAAAETAAKAYADSLATNYDAAGSAAAAETAAKAYADDVGAAIETKLTQGATGYDINAKSLQIQGSAVATESYTDGLAKMTSDSAAGTTRYATGDAVNAALTAIDGALYTAEGKIDMANASAAGASRYAAGAAVNAALAAVDSALKSVEDTVAAWTDGDVATGGTISTQGVKVGATGLNVTGDTQVAKLTATGDTTLAGLTASGEVNLGGTGSTVNIGKSGESNTNVLGNLAVNGNYTSTNGHITTTNGNITTTNGTVTGAKLVAGTSTITGTGNVGTNDSEKVLTTAAAYTELRMAADGTYAKMVNTTAQNLSALDSGLKGVADLIGAPDTAKATSGLLKDVAITADSAVEGHASVIEAIHTIATTAAGTAANNTFTGVNTFANSNGIKIGNMTDTEDAGYQEVALTTDNNGVLNIGGDTKIAGDLEAANATLTSLQFADGNQVSAVDVNGNAVSSAAAAATTLATGATVYSGAKNADYNVGGDAGNNIAVDSTLGGAIGQLDTALTAITGGTAVSGTVANNYLAGTGATPAVSYAALTDASTIPLATAIGQINTNIGTEGQLTTAGTNGVAADQTVNANIDAVNAKVGDVDNMTNTNGNLDTTSVAASLDQIDTNMGALASMNHAAFSAVPGDITSGVNNLATNLAGAIGGTFTAGAWTNTVDNTAGYADYAETTDVVSAINQVASNIGQASDLTTAGTNGVAADQTVNANIDAINGTIGDITTLSAGTESTGNAITNGTGVAATTVVEALNNIDATLGKIHGLKATSDLGDNSNLAEGTTVEQHLVSLDNAIGDLSQLVNSRYADGATSVADSVVALDNNLSRVEDHVDALDKRVGKMHHEMKSGFASLAAMSALVPNARVAGDTQIAVGTGYYRGTTGFAIGAFHHVNDNVLLNAGASYAGNGAAVFKGGVTFGF